MLDTQCHPLLAHSRSDAPSIQRTLGSLKTVLSALKSDEGGGNSAQSLIQALTGLSGPGADDVASVISNFLEGLGSAAGISVDDGPLVHQGFPSEMASLGGTNTIDRRSESFPTQREDVLFVDSLFQVDEEL